MLNVASNLRYTEKVFTVDVKRPAAGKAKWEMEFGDDQYFDKVSAEIEDETIKEVSAAVNSLLGTILPGGASRSSLTTGNSPDVLKELKVVAGTRSVAWAEFDINDCDFEEQVRSFVDIHLNSCHNCATSPWNAKLPPGGIEMMPAPGTAPVGAPIPAVSPLPSVTPVVTPRVAPVPISNAARQPIHVANLSQTNFDRQPLPATATPGPIHMGGPFPIARASWTAPAPSQGSASPANHVQAGIPNAQMR